MSLPSLPSFDERSEVKEAVLPPEDLSLGVLLPEATVEEGSDDEVVEFLLLSDLTGLEDDD